MSLVMKQLSTQTLRCLASLRSGFVQGSPQGHALGCSARRAAPGTPREFRPALVVCMGRRSAKIANRKARRLAGSHHAARRAAPR